MRKLANVFLVLTVAMSIAPIVTYAFSDPTQPMGYATTTAAHASNSAPSEPVLQSTLVSPQRRLAVISGRRVQVGDRVNGAVITEILPYQVRMKKGGRESTLRLLPKINKDVETVK